MLMRVSVKQKITKNVSKIVDAGLLMLVKRAVTRSRPLVGGAAPPLGAHREDDDLQGQSSAKG